MLGRRDVVGGLIATGAVACSPPPVSNDIETREPDQPPVTFEPSPDLAAIATRSGGRLGVAALDTGSGRRIGHDQDARSEEHTSELQSLMRISSAVFCLKKKKNTHSIKKIKQ